MDKDNSISTRQFLADLKKKVKGFDSLNSAAEYYDVKPSFLRNVLNSRELPGPRILKRMQLKAAKQIKYRYERIKGKS